MMDNFPTDVGKQFIQFSIKSSSYVLALLTADTSKSVVHISQSNIVAQSVVPSRASNPSKNNVIRSQLKFMCVK